MLERFDETDYTYGYITKHHRIGQGLEKTHLNDAFCISGGKSQARAIPIMFTQTRRNIRNLERWYDARYIDTRTGMKTEASGLNCGRNKRDKSTNGENLKMYRGRKVSKGRRSIRKQRYSYQPNDLVRYEGRIYTVRGTQNKGLYVALKETKKVAKASALQPYRYQKGMA